MIILAQLTFIKIKHKKSCIKPAKRLQKKKKNRIIVTMKIIFIRKWTNE